MSQIVLGRRGNRDVRLDVHVLLKTRLLVQANSGSGKSWLLRRLAEQLFGKVPVVIIDPEGEFATLREKFGYVLVGKGGEAAADPRSAGLLAEKLLELRASAVCDLYEAFRKSPSERRLWVRKFLEAFIDAPKKLWRPVAVIVDEAHKFCPQETPKAGTQAERDAVIGCKEAMIALSTVGRKRRFCAVWATQRLAKVDKDASAELLNRLVGGTFEDVDIKRAVDLLSVSDDERAEFKKQIKVLAPGEFFAFGRAVSKERVLLKIGRVLTTHPDIDSTEYSSGPPPPPEKVKALLPKLADLPREAEEREKTVAELKQEIRSLKAQLRAQPRQAGERKTIQVVDQRAIERAVRASEEQVRKQFVAVHASRKKLLANGAELARALARLAEAASKAFIKEVAEDQHAAVPTKPAINVQSFLKKEPRPIPSGGVRERPVLPAPVARSTRVPRSNPSDDGDPGDVKGTPLRILRGLADFEALGRPEVARPTLASWCGVKHTTGTFSNYLSELRTRGLIEDSADKKKLRLTDAGRELAGPAEAPITSAEMLERCLQIMNGTPGKILKVLHERYPEFLSYDELGQSLNPPISGDTGTFSNYISALNVAEMIEKGPNRTVRCADWLFID